MLLTLEKTFTFLANSVEESSLQVFFKWLLLHFLEYRINVVSG